LLEETKQQVLRSRGIFERAFESLRTTAPEQKEERAMLLEEWRDTEASFADLGDVATVQRKMPRRVKRKRPISSEDGTPAGYKALFSQYMNLLS
jgi:crooked neck